MKIIFVANISNSVWNIKKSKKEGYNEYNKLLFMSKGKKKNVLKFIDRIKIEKE